MARKTKNHKMQMSPIMSLAVLALFAMMIPIFSIANSNQSAVRSQAATPSPSPEAMDDLMMEK